jgi:2-keto-4-pentenoate hydratase
LQAGDVITTGTCVKPIDILPGDTVVADFGALGTVTAGFD